MSATTVLPQPVVGEVMASETQPFSRICRRILVRSMSKVRWLGSVRAKETMRSRRMRPGSGSKGGSSPQASAEDAMAAGSDPRAGAGGMDCL